MIHAWTPVALTTWNPRLLPGPPHKELTILRTSQKHHEHSKLGKLLKFITSRYKNSPFTGAPRTWRRRTGCQLKTWSRQTWNPSPDHESSASHARWRKDWGKVSSELAPDIEPGVPPYETWSRELVMPAQPTPGECRSKYKQAFTGGHYNSFL